MASTAIAIVSPAAGVEGQVPQAGVDLPAAGVGVDKARWKAADAGAVQAAAGQEVCPSRRPVQKRRPVADGDAAALADAAPQRIAPVSLTCCRLLRGRGSGRITTRRCRLATDRKSPRVHQRESGVPTTFATASAHASAGCAGLAGGFGVGGARGLFRTVWTTQHRPTLTDRSDS